MHDVDQDKPTRHQGRNGREQSREEKLGNFLGGRVGGDSSILTQLASMVIDRLIIRATSGNRIAQWNHRVTRYLRSPWSPVAKNHKDISQTRNNLNRALAKRSVTWKNFMEVLRITGAKKIVFKIELTDNLGRTHLIEKEIPNHYGLHDEIVDLADDEKES